MIFIGLEIKPYGKYNVYVSVGRNVIVHTCFQIQPYTQSYDSDNYL